MKISSWSWRVLLNQIRKNLNHPGQERLPRVACLGVGNELNGDDAVGLRVLRLIRLKKKPAGHWLLLETGPAPENFTAPLVRFAPDWVLVVDAAQMRAQPGRIAYIGLDEVDGIGAFTHGLPLSMLGRYLMVETGCQFGLLGIQAQETGFGAPFSPAVERAAQRLAQTLAVFE